MTDVKDKRVPEEHHRPSTGHWMSQDKRHHHKFLHDTVEHVDANPKPFHPVIKEFGDAIKKDSRLWMLFNTMFEQVPHNKPYLQKDPSGETATVRDFDHLLSLLNHVITTAPHWTHAENQAGLVGVPVNALLDWPMGTTAGFAVFQDPKVNSYLKKLLNVWGEYLSSPASASVLGTDLEGWFSEEGVKNLEDVANNGQTSYKFDELFECDPKAEHHGYKSWDDFFTRPIKETVRPVAEPENDDVVVNACESTLYKVARNTHRRDKFWVKGQPYSVIDMLAFDDLAEDFVGGTIYQAFLSALSYHRWHTPVSGTIKKAYVVDGTYYSEPLFTDFNAGGTAQADPQGETTSQEYISATATRGIIFIEADNPKIGLMAFIAIGMTEVSTCDITVKEGQHLKKGDQLGMFHFGGSSHCTLFRKEVKVTGFPEYTDHNVPVRSKLCVVE